MASTGLNVTLSSLSQASAGRARNPDRLARLQALDKNGGQFTAFPVGSGQRRRTIRSSPLPTLRLVIPALSHTPYRTLPPADGQLDLDEVCDAIEKIIRKEKTERTLKWLLAALAVFSLLTIAATVGLTYAVVALSKDTKVNGDVLQSKDSGGAMRTGSFLQSQNVSVLVAAVEASDDPDAVLGRINSIKVPSLKIGEAYTVYKVDAVTMMMNRSVLVKTSTGLDILMPVESIEQRPDFWSLLNITKARQSSESGRKLLAVDTSACFKVSQIWGFCYRLFCEFGDDKTIDDIINAWNNPDKTCNTHLPSVQSLPAPPMLQALDPSTIKLKIDVEKSATYDRSATLGSIKSQIKNPQNNGLYDNGFWLFLDSRHVTM